MIPEQKLNKQSAWIVSNKATNNNNHHYQCGISINERDKEKKPAKK